MNSSDNSPEYEEILTLYKETVIVRLRGMFYNAFEESAFVLSVLTGYKTKKSSLNAMCKCGYPETAFDKVLELFKRNHVNYVIYKGSEIIEEEVFEDNQYNIILKGFDKNVIEISESAKKDKVSQRQIKNNYDNANVTQIIFKCPNQIAEEIEALYKAHNEFFGIDVYPKDMFISSILMKGVRDYKKENADYKRD